MPSFLKHIEQGFEYWIVLAYDFGDPFYDNQDNLGTIRQWVDRNVVQPAQSNNANADGVAVQFRTMGFNNTLRKPGPIFNFMLRSMYEDGADYFYRINDDTVILGPWAETAVKTLQQRRIPNFGVIGPQCAQSPGMLTHDFVHKTHFDIFPDYYPKELIDWWMDNWMNDVYGSAYTSMGPFAVGHSMKHSTRYSVDFHNQRYLNLRLTQGKQLIQTWAQAHGYSY